jgi:hypothetical protein
VQKAKRTRIRDIIGGDDFVALLEKSLAILNSIDELILRYQTDSVPVSEVMPDFRPLRATFSQLQVDGLVKADERNYLAALATSRFRFM